MEKELAYAAGLIDGEGCIGMYLNSHSGHYQLRITVEMVERHGLDALAKLFGGRWYKKEAKRPRRARLMWMVFNSEAEAALQRLEPYLLIKKSHAQIALEADWHSFIAHPLSAQERTTRESVAKRIKKLNQRGYYGEETKQS